MAKIKYYYNSDTCKYEPIKSSPWDWFLNVMAFVLSTLIFALSILLFYVKYFDSPKEANLRKEKESLEFYHKIFSEETHDIQKRLKLLQKKDIDIYRTIFQSDPMSLTLKATDTKSSDIYKKINESDIEQKTILLDLTKRLENLKKQIYNQTKSYDEILSLAKKKDDLTQSIPAIQPILNPNLDKLSSGYGPRIDPFLKVRRMHEGVDFSATLGTEIHATGNGVVILVKSTFWGYGKHIMIDHGFGYKTLYAHMSSFNVKQGQKVTRGDIIGFVGSTGKSTAPHLHYEIHINGKRENPVAFFSRDMTPEQYEEIIRLASIENQSLGNGE
ncbi:MAG: M23 family metallopeptidase [Chitinophagaceae bacterium]|nr:M23 family metallopeptidase [Chitinophagaceae bacterium]